MSNLRQTLARLFKGHARKRHALPQVCDTCAFVEFFRSNGDGQSARLQAFCRCPQSPFHDRPIPRTRRCDFWQQADRPAEKPPVGDPNLTV